MAFLAPEGALAALLWRSGGCRPEGPGGGAVGTCAPRGVSD